MHRMKWEVMNKWKSVPRNSGQIASRFWMRSKRLIKKSLLPNGADRLQGWFTFAQQKDKDPLLGSMEGLVETIGDLTEPVIEHKAWELD